MEETIMKQAKLSQRGYLYQRLKSGVPSFTYWPAVWLIVLAVFIGPLPPTAPMAREAVARADLSRGGTPLTAKDYIFPRLEQLAERTVLRRTAAGCIDCGEVVQYRAFNGTMYTLTQFSGKNVAVLLPDSWMNGLSRQERRTLIDRCDLLYEHLKELIGEEPGGSGLLPIAFVRDTCGWGCGYIGAKGVEILDADWSLDIVRQDVAAGNLPGVVVHEMNHNFDVYSAYLHYLPDHGHAWTDLMDTYIRIYSRMGFRDLSPEEIQRFEIRQKYVPYISDETATWEHCVRDGLCQNRGIIRNYVWAALNHYVAQLHGARAILGFMSFLRNYKATHRPPTSPEAKEDLRIEALAFGTGLNLGCYVDTWRWYASAELRARMTAQYGTNNPFCFDNDGDGFSEIQGDCDDSNPAINPGATDLMNGLDDDCDLVADDGLFTEPPDGDFPNPQPLTYPARIVGRITDNDADFFTFSLPTARRVRFTLQSTPDFSGWIFVYNRSGGWYGYQWVPKGGLSTRIYDLNAAAVWRFGVELNNASQPGRYSVEIADAARWPVMWGTTEPPAFQNDAYRLMVHTETLEGVLETPTHVRFWVSGVGFVGTAPFASSAFVNWMPTGSLAEGTYGYRAQLVSDAIPVADATAAEWFELNSRKR
jgi:hypothetical protein